MSYNLTPAIRKILSCYESDNPGTKANLARILMCGKLSGTGKLLVLPVDQGFEHGPIRSFEVNRDSYSPNYHIELAIEAGLSAYAAPLGMIEAVASTYAGCIPLILKINSANSLNSKIHDYDQGLTSSVDDALRLGCGGIGFTIYPGSDNFYNMVEKFQEIAKNAKKAGLIVVVWSYPRGNGIGKKGETAIDIISYAAHIAALLGAHIIKVKLPSDNIELSENETIYKQNGVELKSLVSRVGHIMNSAFAGTRLVLFSGGAAKEDSELYEEIKAIKEGGGSGSIIGRNTFQRPKGEALKMLNNIIEIYSAI